jgi:hypothetical protein
MFLEIDDTRSRRVAVQELSDPLCVEGRTACGQDDLINNVIPSLTFSFCVCSSFSSSFPAGTA